MKSQGGYLFGLTTKLRFHVAEGLSTNPKRRSDEMGFRGLGQKPLFETLLGSLSLVLSFKEIQIITFYRGPVRSSGLGPYEHH